jgi:hypothetical protein
MWRALGTGSGYARKGFSGPRQIVLHFAHLVCSYLGRKSPPELMTSAAEAAALGHAEFWNERYSKAADEKPTHEWFRGFASLEPFLAKHLFSRRDAQTRPRIMHLGSGDSVRVSSAALSSSICMIPLTACDDC